MNKQFIAIVIVVILGLFGIFAVASKNKDGAGGGSGSSSSEASNYVKGEGKKNVTLVEYGDFQCPACKSYYPIVKQLEEEYKEDVKFQFRNFPLVQIHPHAFKAARAAVAAGNQGKFFEMHDLMYENQDNWTQLSDVSSTFEAYASQLGLDMDKFKADVASEATNSQINADIEAGQALGANSTPTFVINGKKIDQNPKSFDEFKKLIDEAIAQSNPS